ncbi:cupin-like domain-containing protein [Tribonema minus]|uniref:Cupin-like domain-containing protein n=1 Tax=Tribonema minus TaxID=303371 RepID=A0A836CMX0_9STRA|nr:cupin-like domain-containing protein [Tribonema minus]
MELSMCCIASSEPDKPVAVPQLAPCFRAPAFIDETELLQICLWAGPQETSTNLHYDCNHNVLFVLAGSKVVTLLPPSATPRVKAFPAYATTPNHSALSAHAAAAAARAGAAAGDGSARVTVAAGAALFIPEGWWHQVESAPRTVAVNVWYEGVRAAIAKQSSGGGGGGGGGGATAYAYLLRCAAHELVAAARAESRRRLLGDAARRHQGDDQHGTERVPVRLNGAAAPAAAPPPPPPTDAPTQSQAARGGAGLASMSVAEMRAAAAADGGAWRRALRALPPAHADAVTSAWEAAAAQAATEAEADALYEALAMDAETRSALLRLTQEHARRVCLEELERVLGPLAAAAAPRRGSAEEDGIEM